MNQTEARLTALWGVAAGSLTEPVGAGRDHRSKEFRAETSQRWPDAAPAGLGSVRSTLVAGRASLEAQRRALSTQARSLVVLPVGQSEQGPKTPEGP
jgi:hypothetical protein